MQYCDNPNCACHRGLNHERMEAEAAFAKSIVGGAPVWMPDPLNLVQIGLLNEATLTKPEIERAISAKLPGARLIVQHANGKRFWQIVLKVARPQDGKGKYRRYTASLKLDPTEEQTHAKCAELFAFMQKNGDA